VRISRVAVEEQERLLAAGDAEVVMAELHRRLHGLRCLAVPVEKSLMNFEE
jgi:hypothetical protein